MENEKNKIPDAWIERIKDINCEAPDPADSITTALVSWAAMVTVICILFLVSQL